MVEKVKNQTWTIILEAIEQEYIEYSVSYGIFHGGEVEGGVVKYYPRLAVAEQAFTKTFV